MSIKTDRLLAKAKKLLKKGEVSEARDIYTTILKSFPNNQEAKKGISKLDKVKDLRPSKLQLDSLVNLYSTGQMKEALSDLEVLIQKYPKEPLLFNISGACYTEINQIEEAIPAFNKAIEIKSDYAEAHFNLGVAYQKISQLDNAFECYSDAIKYNPAYPTAHNNLGVIFLEKDQFDSAVKSFEWAIAYSPNYAEAHNNLGKALQELKQFENAKNHFQKATSLNSNYAQAFNNLGVLNEIINLPKEAMKNYEKAIEINPEYAEAYRNLSKIKTFKPKDKQIAQMQSFYSKNNLNLFDKTRLSFALAKVNKDLGNIDEYFKYLNEGNKLRKEELNYSFDQSKNFHAEIIKLFNSPQPPINNKISSNYQEIKPIFIVGMPRSGTTLVEQIISSHPSVYGAGELLAIRKIISPILENHLRNNNDSLSEQDLLKIRQQYLDTLSNLGADEKIITDKMPVNFRLIGFILSAIPEAKIIHIKRDAIATCWSNYNHFFTAGNGFSFDQEDLVKFYVLYKEIMEFWNKLFPNKIYNMSYEELTTNQKKQTQRILEYCDLDWNENCLNFHENTRAVLTASSSQVRQKIYQGSSEAWKQYENYLKPFVKGLEKL